MFADCDFYPRAVEAYSNIISKSQGVQDTLPPAELNTVGARTDSPTHNSNLTRSK